MTTHMRANFGIPLAASTSRRSALRGLGGAGLGAVLVLGGARGAAAHGAEEVASEAIEALGQALATGDESGLDALFVPDVMVQPAHRMLATGEEVSPDLAGLKAALADMRSVARGVELSVEDVIAQEDKAAGRFTFRGTLEPSGQALEGAGLFFLVVADDLVRELWIYPEPYLMMDIMPLVGMATPAA